MEVYIKGYTWKKKSAKGDPEIVYVDNSEKETEFTLTGLEKHQTYTLTAFAQVEGNDSFTYSDPLDVFTGEVVVDGDYQLVFSEEFNGTGAPDPNIWSFEEGEYIRNHEPQFYSKSVENAYQEDGCLHIVARKNHMGSDGTVHNYTSASMTTSKSFVWCYGRMEVRAKIPTGSGLWPAIWMVGNDYNWPSNGELDVMEYYREKILANAAWGSSKQWTAIWDSSSKPMSYFEAKNPNWRNEFHIWVTEWDEDYIRIFLDDELLNEIDLNKTYNQGGYKGNTENPFRYHKAGWGDYIWLNLALGGDNGGTIDDSLLPATYLVDYVRVYQKQRLPE
ncbi:MAG TPA: beta-glucanase [Bacteroidales bacterium]|nr:beta-glucanase [Bacteroidales bacterium]